MKSALRLVALAALTVALCGSAAFATTMNQSVVEDLSKTYGIFDYAKPGVIATAVAGAVIWACSLLLLTTSVSHTTK